MAFTRKTRRNLLTGLGFLSPNILGFLTFTLIPLVLSMALAFSNWDLKLHNMFKAESISFVGFANFVRLFQAEDFYKYLGNTLFFMMGIPFSIAGSLCLALLLSKDMSGGGRGVKASLVVGAVFVACMGLLAAVGMGGTAMTLLLVGLAGGMLVLGVSAGTTVYRTLFYLPSFTSGVAVFILWKKLYAPANGPINMALAGPLASLTEFVRGCSPVTFTVAMGVLLGLAALVAVRGLRRLMLMWGEGDLGSGAAVVPVLLLLLPSSLGLLRGWIGGPAAVQVSGMVWTWPGLALWGVIVAYLLMRAARVRKPELPCKSGSGFGTAFMFALALMVLQFVLMGLAKVSANLPAMAGMAGGVGIRPPQWLVDYDWAKPAIMLMGFWGSIGSGNMLLYLAGLSNIPPELYEAADIDGATAFQKFWHVTWPQLAPTTFFIVVMGVIGGLQGGFEMARTMTQGGPAGSTTTLSYFIYTEGFSTGRLGYASAVAWTLFALVFLVTLFNWKFGNRYVND